MSQDQTSPAETTTRPPNTGDSHAPGFPSLTAQFLSEIKEGLDLGPITAEAKALMIKTLADKEKNSRAETLADAYQCFKTVQGKLSAVKPIPDRFDVDGKPVGVPSFSAAQVKERKALTEQLAKGEQAIKKALNPPYDFNDMKKWIAGVKSGKPVEEKEADAD